MGSVAEFQDFEAPAVISVDVNLSKEHHGDLLYLRSTRATDRPALLEALENSSKLRTVERQNARRSDSHRSFGARLTSGQLMLGYESPQDREVCALTHGYPE